MELQVSPSDMWILILRKFAKDSFLEDNIVVENIFGIISVAIGSFISTMYTAVLNLIKVC